MRIGVFSYDFPHKKSRDGLFNMFLHDYTPEVVLAAPWQKLNIEHSKIRLVTRGIEYVHPRLVSEKLGIDYHVVNHNDRECVRLIEQYDLDLGVVLGARILSKEVIDAFKIGVLNLHPGILPENRGLDTVKWAMVEGLEQGVTAHLIDDKIDMGRKIIKSTVKTYHGDTLLDISTRVQEQEQRILPWALDVIKAGCLGTPLAKGKYHKAMPWSIEQDLI